VISRLPTGQSELRGLLPMWPGNEGFVRAFDRVTKNLLYALRYSPKFIEQRGGGASCDDYRTNYRTNRFATDMAAVACMQNGGVAAGESRLRVGRGSGHGSEFGKSVTSKRTKRVVAH